MSKPIRLATRESKLAMWQAHFVKQQLESAHPGLSVEIVGMTTEGDRNKTSPLASLGGKGVFVKELETALLEGRVDIAVHSMKDMPGVLPDNLYISAICEREDPRDAFLSHKAETLSGLAAGDRVGSSSLRRRYQLQQTRPELSYLDLRGNVDTRLRKLDEGEYEAIILAVAGLKRLGFESRITQSLATNLSIPAAGQGAVGIEAREDDARVNELLVAINHADTFDCVTCERGISIGLGASCNMPLAAFAELEGETMCLRTYVASADGSASLFLEDNAPRSDAMVMAQNMVKDLKARGVDDFLLGPADPL